MTFEEAEALAIKREAHKSKFMTNKHWAPVHDSVKGWHVALIDNFAAIDTQQRLAAFNAYRRGDLRAFMNHASEALLAKCADQIERHAESLARSNPNEGRGE